MLLQSSAKHNGISFTTVNTIYDLYHIDYGEQNNLTGEKPRNAFGKYQKGTLWDRFNTNCLKSENVFS